MKLPFNPQSLAVKLIGGALAVVLAIGLFTWWLSSREKAAVDADRASGRAVATERQLDAERAAQGKLDAVQAINAAEAEKTDQAMKDAEDANPVEARAGAGPVANAAAARLRERARRSDPAAARTN